MKNARRLLRWGLFRLPNSGPYLAGLQSDGLERTSTPLIELDLQQGTALTASGRPYHLTGQPDADFGLKVANTVLGLYYNMEDAAVTALTVDEAVALMKSSGNAPFNHTPEERAEIAKRSGIRLDANGEVAAPDPLAFRSQV
jgi:hypothetical protein